MKNKYFILSGDSYADLSVESVRAWLKNHTDTQSIADAFAIVSNKAWLSADEEYDFEEGTTAYTYACETADSWFKLMDELLEKIFEYLRKDGVFIPDKGRITVVAPFMKKYGYIDGNGWWIKQQ